MTCPLCGSGELRNGTTTFVADVDGTVVVVRHVPAEVCEVCGEAFVSDATTVELETTVTAAKGHGTESVVRHYERIAS